MVIWAGYKPSAIEWTEIDPESLTPKGHVYWSKHLTWLGIDDDLPKFAETSVSLQKDN
jgi:hypothetical protein